VSLNPPLVIPKQLREALGLHPGIKINIKLEGDEITLKLIKENIPDRIYGKYWDINLLGDLEKEHRREIKRELD